MGMGMVSMNGLMGGHPMLGSMLAGDMAHMGLPAMSMAMPGEHALPLACEQAEQLLLGGAWQAAVGGRCGCSRAWRAVAGRGMVTDEIQTDEVLQPW
jgi:hypothetical protein